MASPQQLPSTANATIGAQLERDRLVGRVHRLERVIEALRVRAEDHVLRGGEVPSPLTCSLDDFHRELTAVRHLLHQMQPGH